MSHTTNEVINPLNQYTMQTKRYMLIHMDKNVHHFKWLSEAKRYAIINCRGSYEYYVIIDTRKNEVVDKWSY